MGAGGRGGLSKDKEVFDWAGNRDIPINKRKSHLLTGASEGLTAVGESEFSLGAVQRTKDLWTVTTTDLKWVELCKAAARKARGELFRLSAVNL